MADYIHRRFDGIDEDDNIGKEIDYDNKRIDQLVRAVIGSYEPDLEPITYTLDEKSGSYQNASTVEETVRDLFGESFTEYNGGFDMIDEDLMEEADIFGEYEDLRADAEGAADEFTMDSVDEPEVDSDDEPEVDSDNETEVDFAVGSADELTDDPSDNAEGGSDADYENISSEFTEYWYNEKEIEDDFENALILDSEDDDNITLP